MLEDINDIEEKERRQSLRNKDTNTHGRVVRKMTPRSLSAPERITRQRSRFVEQHFKIDQINLSLLPGVPVHEADFARDFHDFFNLISLVPIVILNLMNWNVELYFSGKFNKFETLWTGDYFDVFWNSTIAYFVIDLLWICIIPKCVEYPIRIIQHHIMTLFILMVPYFYSEYRWMMGFSMSVELNIWFLIARRVFNKQGFPPWTIDLPHLFSLKVKFISIFFYITWVLTRCIIIPYMVILLYQSYFIRVEEVGSYFNVLLFAFLFHMISCFSNVKWTYDLVYLKMRRLIIRDLEEMDKNK